MKIQKSTKQVLVVGAGPTGLSVAAALTKLGISVEIIEQKPGLSDTTKATNLMQGTQEQLAIYDLIEPMYRMSGKMSRIIMEGYGVNLGARTMHLTESPFEDVLLLGQDNIEKSLASSLLSLGIEVSFSTRLINLSQQPDGVKVALLVENAEVEEYYQYVIGCDGPWGITRTFTACNFKPVKTGRSIRQVDAKLKWKRLNSMKQMWLFYFADGFAVVVPLLDGYYRVLTIEPSENIPDRNPQLEEIRQKLIEVTKDNSIEMTEPKWFSHANLSMGIAPCIIDKRVFLAGDAGNPILPNGGQGLNTGIQDSLNLAWKLASVIKGKAKNNLLDSYQDERLALRIALEKVQFNSLKYTTKAPGYMQWLIRRFGNTLLNKGGEYQMAKAFSQLNVNYKKSILTKELVKGGNVKAGGRILDGDLIKASDLTEVSLFKQLSTPVWKLVYFACKKEIPDDIVKQLLLLEQKGIELLIITSSLEINYTYGHLHYDIDELVHTKYGFKMPTFLLVRPDNYVAVRTNTEKFNVMADFINEWFS